MVADKVEIISKSYKEGESAVHWTCDGSPEFTLEETTAKQIVELRLFFISLKTQLSS